jgi:DNA-directed RNA polymerase subunit K/omega
VLLVSKRAEQLIQGSQPKLRTRHSKATRVAMEEINKGAVRWQLHQPIEDDNPLLAPME